MMGLRELLDDASLPDIALREMTLDSRRVEAGDVFIALPGLAQDGRDFLGDALARGAAAVLAESANWGSAGTPYLADPRVVPLHNLRNRLGALADRFYGSPSRHLSLIAVTGTNGKTSVVDLTAQLLRELGARAGSIGTLGLRLDQQPTEASNTTPDCVSLHRQLRSWQGHAVQWVAMEASSHALDQGRLDGLEVAAGVFTNLSRDHLDYHGSLEAYCTAKMRLFREFAPRVKVYNADDPTLAGHADVWADDGLGISFHSASAPVRISLANTSPLAFRLDTPWGSAKLTCALSGHFNAFNLSAAIVTLIALGHPFARVIEVASRVQPVLGRLQAIDTQSDITVVVDYAHTPDALERALLALRDGVQQGQLWVLFGCGGDRDRGKRPLMGAVATRLADRVVVTSDNPRSESPESIVDDILAGCEGTVPLVEVDRAAAIALAISRAAAGDTVLIAGKGHETYQETSGQRIQFSDAEHAAQHLALRQAA